MSVRRLGVKVATKIYNRGRVPLVKGSGALAEYLLSQHKQKKLATKPSYPFRYLSMVGRKHWLLLRESLVSLHRSWRSIPSLTVVSDGSWGKKEFIDAFRFWPEPIEVLLPEDITTPLSKAGQNTLVQLAAQHPLGLKLAAIIYLAQFDQTLFVDSDILWFSDPEPILTELRDLPGPTTSIELGGSFNQDLLKRHHPEGFSPPYVNTGCVYLKGDLCTSDLLQAMLTTALEQPTNYFNEQAIIAIAVHRNGRLFSDDFCLVDFDALAIRRHPWRKFRACHYVHWMRHQFYRDALWLRMKSDS